MKRILLEPYEEADGNVTTDDVAYVACLLCLAGKGQEQTVVADQPRRDYLVQSKDWRLRCNTTMMKYKRVG